MPRWARSLLRANVPRARFDDVIGDLQETRGLGPVHADTP